MNRFADESECENFPQSSRRPARPPGRRPGHYAGRSRLAASGGGGCYDCAGRTKRPLSFAGGQGMNPKLMPDKRLWGRRAAMDRIERHYEDLPEDGDTAA